MLAETQHDYTVKTQTMLNANGYGPLNVDGIWGSKTEAAWKHFAADGLKVGLKAKKETNFPTSDSSTGQGVLQAARRPGVPVPGANTPWYANLVSKYIDVRYPPAGAIPLPGKPGEGGQGGGLQFSSQAETPWYQRPAFYVPAALGVAALIYFGRKRGASSK